ncbi:hypothetical protein ACCC96_12430 [Pseudomonas sp. Pseusp11]|uniref:hypothetical protein n=1 Tax=Pseudomonas sp. Pseusp11 TaxID=3243003 RepID=UPI0039B37704
MTDKISSHESAILNDFSERPQTSSLEPVDSGCLEELLQRDTRLIYWRTLSDSPSVVSAAAPDTVDYRLWIQPVDEIAQVNLTFCRWIGYRRSELGAAAETGSGNVTANEGVICIRHRGVAILLG